MTKYTDAEIDAVALAARNAHCVATGFRPYQGMSYMGESERHNWRAVARAALAARDALFEVVRERWVIRGPRGFWSSETREEALALAEEKRAAGVKVRLKHVVTKRKKARVGG